MPTRKWKNKSLTFELLTEANGNGVLKICSKFTGEHPCRSAISINQLYRNCTSARVFSCKFAAYFQNTFYQDKLLMAASEYCNVIYFICTDIFACTNPLNKKRIKMETVLLYEWWIRGNGDDPTVKTHLRIKTNVLVSLHHNMSLFEHVYPHLLSR